MTSVPFDVAASLIYIDADLTGPAGLTTTLRMVLDTGASRTLINSDVLRLVGYDPRVATTHARIATASGVEEMAELPVRGIQALGRVRSDLVVLCHDIPLSITFDGLLGLDFLRGSRLTLDFQRGEIELAW